MLADEEVNCLVDNLVAESRRRFQRTVAQLIPAGMRQLLDVVGYIFGIARIRRTTDLSATRYRFGSLALNREHADDEESSG